MTNAMMSLRAFVEKNPDTIILHETIVFTVERLCCNFRRWASQPRKSEAGHSGRKPHQVSDAYCAGGEANTESARRQV